MTAKNTSTILLIEDNRADAELIKIMLQDAGSKFDLLVASGLFDAAELVGQRDDIELVLLDLNLPDSQGFKTLNTFRDRYPAMPVVVITGTNNEIVGNQSVKAGAQDYLVKGQIDGKLLGRTIRYAIQRARSQQELAGLVNNLTMSEKRYAEARQLARLGTWEMDLVSHNMQWSSEVFQIFNLPPYSIEPSLSDYLANVHFDDKAAVEHFFDKAGKDGQTHTIEHRLLLDGRTIRHVIIQAKVYAEPNSHQILLLGAIQDITERKQHAQLLAERNISERANKLQYEALKDIGFQMRTPLSSMVNLMFILEQEKDSQHINNYLKDFKQSLQDLSITVNQLMNFSFAFASEGKATEQPFSVQELWQSLSHWLMLKATRDGIIPTIQPVKIEGEVIGDPNRLNQIVYNLFEYAVQSSQGAVELSMDLEASTNALRISVVQEGPVLTKEQIQHLVTSDQLLEVQVDNPDLKELGMAVAVQMLKASKGALEIVAGTKGNTIIATLPVKLPRKRVILEGQDKPDVALKILLVEDHFLNQIATRKVLTAWSSFVTVDVAENGLVGVDKFREHGYDLVLMDIQMPVMDGWEATTKIREKNKEVPILALTANASNTEREKCIAAGMNDYLAKPFKPQDLYERIMTLLAAVGQPT